MNATKKLFRGFRGEVEIYRALRVEHFKKIVPLGDYWLLAIRWIKPDFRIIRGRQSALIWTIFTLCVEALHGLAMIAMFGYVAAAFWSAQVGTAISTSLLNIIVNVYPMMVQRYNRIRLVRAFGIEPADLNGLEVHW